MNSNRGFDDHASALTPEEALRRDLEDLHIEDGTEVDVSPDRRHAQCFARVQARSIADLQMLGLVPRGLGEDHLRRAIRSDDDSALEMARKTLGFASASQCHCDCPDGEAVPYRNQLASRYASIRRSFNPALADLLSKHQRTDFSWDSVHVQSVRGWTSRVGQLVSETPLLVSIFRDIYVGRQARMVLNPKATVLLARGLYIHESGSLVHRGSYLKIWASSVERWSDLSTIVTQHDIPWALT